MRILAYALQTVQCKNLQIKIVLCLHFRNTTFVLGKTVMETRLISAQLSYDVDVLSRCDQTYC